MIKNIRILSLSFLLLLPPMLSASGSFGKKMPDMAKGFKRSLFDKETRDYCEKKMKEPIDLKTAKIIHNGPMLGEAMYQAVHLSFAAAMGYVVQKAMSGPATPVNDTRGWVETKNSGGIKGALATGLETAIVVGAPGAYASAAVSAVETGIAVEGYVTGFAGKASAHNPFAAPAATALPPLTGAAAKPPVWITEARVNKAISASPYVGPVATATVYGGIKGTGIETGLAAMASDVSSWNSSPASTKGSAVLVGSAASQGLGSTSVFAAVEIAAQAARAWGYAQLWCP